MQSNNGIEPTPASAAALAWLGLVPRHHSSGGRTRLLGIPKRGDRYIRTLLKGERKTIVARGVSGTRRT